MTSTPSPQQRSAATKKAKTRSKIVRAVNRVVTEENWSPRVEDIAAEADVGMATIYKTFGTKGEMFVAAFEDLVLAELSEHVEKLVSSSASWSARVESYAHQLDLLATRNPGLAKVVMIARLTEGHTTDPVLPAIDAHIQSLVRYQPYDDEPAAMMFGPEDRNHYEWAVGFLTLIMMDTVARGSHLDGTATSEAFRTLLRVHEDAWPAPRSSTLLK
jgi:AcrR family transcriptional regulator